VVGAAYCEHFVLHLAPTHPVYASRVETHFAPPFTIPASPPPPPHHRPEQRNMHSKTTYPPLRSPVTGSVQ
jgi:hypothetical protein